MHEEGSFAAALICSSAKALAAGVVERQIARDPSVVDSYGRGQLDLTMDTEVRLGYLAEALAADRPGLLTEQLGWLKILCASRGIPTEALISNLECTAEELESRLPAHLAPRVKSMLRVGIDYVEAAPSEAPSHLEGDVPHIGLAREFLLAVLESREADATDMIMRAMDNGITMVELHELVLLRVQAEIGRMWQMAEITIAEEHYCTGIVSTVLTLMRARAPRPTPNGKRVITTTVSNETHALGIFLVAQAFESEGWTTVNLGANTPTKAIIEAVRDFGCDVIALSVSQVLYVRQTADMIATLRTHEITSGIPILVGGRPFSYVEDLWQVVGADGCVATAMDAPHKAAEMLTA